MDTHYLEKALVDSYDGQNAEINEDLEETEDPELSEEDGWNIRQLIINLCVALIVMLLVLTAAVWYLYTQNRRLIMAEQSFVASVEQESESSGEEIPGTFL